MSAARTSEQAGAIRGASEKGAPAVLWRLCGQAGAAAGSLVGFSVSSTVREPRLKLSRKRPNPLRILA